MSAGRDGAALLWSSSGAAPAGWRQQRLIGYSLSLPGAHEKHARLVPFVPDFPLCFVSHFHLLVMFSPPPPPPPRSALTREWGRGGSVSLVL